MADDWNSPTESEIYYIAIVGDVLLIKVNFVDVGLISSQALYCRCSAIGRKFVSLDIFFPFPCIHSLLPSLVCSH